MSFVFWNFLTWKLPSVTEKPNVSDEHHKFQLRTRAARMLSLVELPIGNLASEIHYQVCVNQESVCYINTFIMVNEHFI
jgi:hypothetical protein